MNALAFNDIGNEKLLHKYGFFRRKGWGGEGIQGKSFTFLSIKGLITHFYSCYVRYQKSEVYDTVEQSKNPRDFISLILCFRLKAILD